ncbi:hypothetical protein RclHR1_06180010 [Rhizophagus clarus]|uniref:BTB domain-containing protein n=1 Tax=Rhizophagus clarus TaxID=94130 RepID=A0A2Z6S376_9GLOM|nr:hypothetical protein RclHR1_06180010 [Rhizophagus clarus]GES87892.1 hypothetical protein GLOIN_2v1772695 [Rhizophagus clarus]
MAQSDIIQDFENLLENGDPYDVIIKSSDNPLKEFKAHSAILRARAPYFSTALETTNKIQDGVHYFEETAIHSSVWPIILRYLYTGQCDLNEQQFSEFTNLLEAADQLGLDKLTDSLKLPPKEIAVPPTEEKSNLVDIDDLSPILSSWIDKKEEISDASNYEFRLIYRASRDGDTYKSFHNHCDDKGANIVIIKKKNSDRIIGGYNPLDWNGTGWKSTMESFIFTLSNRLDKNTAKIGRVIKEKHDKAIYCYNNNGPCWGSKDIRSGLEWSVFPGIIYEDVGFSNYFDDEDYEVFQVISSN